MSRVNHLKTVCFVLISFAFFACKKQPIVVETEDTKIILTRDSLAFFIENQFENSIKIVCDEYLIFKDTLKHIYAQRDNQSLWWDALRGDSSSWANIENTFMHSERHGMKTHYYFLPLVDYYRKQIDSLKSSKESYEILASCELIISNSFLRIYEDIANGRTRPKDVFGKLYLLPLNNIKKLNYSSFLQKRNKIPTLEKLHEDDTTYQELLKILHNEQDKIKKLRTTKIDFSAYPKIEKGDSFPIIEDVIQKLKEKNLPDSSIQHLKDTQIYTNELVDQIRKIQEKYSLTPDGIIGYKTYQIINSTPTDYIQQIRANLERQRWFNIPNKRPFVYINLPEYIIDLNWKDSTSSFKVCIGKNLPDNYEALVQNYTDSGMVHRIPKNMETPQIASHITNLIINPTWTIPFSIIRNEMWGKLVRDPGHLSRTGHKVYLGDSAINSDSIDWSKINRMKIPYQIVQDPGPKNALGTVKFMFHNPFSIYLHDTPNKRAFKRTQRAVSHGCVRLEKPILFGEFMMQNSKKYDADDFRIMMGIAPLDKRRLKEYDPKDTTALIQPLEETTRLWLQKPMPLYFDYRTVYFDRKWNAHQCYDIYDENKHILKAMEKLGY